MEQLIRLELSQFMAKLKMVPTMDKSAVAGNQWPVGPGSLLGSQGIPDQGNPLKESC